MEKSENFTDRKSVKMQELSDILDNLPVGVCVLFMPDDSHQELRLANKEQMRLINPTMKSPDQMSPLLNEVRANYYKNAFSGVHPDDLAYAYEVFRHGFHKKKFTVPAVRLMTSSGKYIWVSMDVKLRENLPDGRLFYAVYRDISEDVKLREELEEQKNVNMEKTILDTIGRLPACSVLYHEKNNGKLVLERCSEEFLHLIGYTKNDLLEKEGIDFLKSIHPDDRDESMKMLKPKLEKNDLHFIMFRIKVKGDGYKWVRANYTWFSFSEEQYLYVVCTDINDLKKHEQKLKDQYSDAQAFLNSVFKTNLITQRANLSHNSIEVMKGRSSLLPYFETDKYDAFTKRLMKLLTTEEDRANCTELLSRQHLLSAFEKGIKTVTKEFCLRTPDHDIKWLKGTMTLSVRPESNDIISFLAVSSIKERKLTELIVHKMVEEQCDYICCIDERSQKIILFIPNERWGDRKKISPGENFEDVIHQTFVTYVEPEYRKEYMKFMNLPSIISQLQMKNSATAVFSGKENGEVRIKQLSFSYLDKDNGLITLIKTDITEAHRQQLEQEESLRMARDIAEKASSAKSDFLSSMSHDLRTPLNAVLGFTDFALKEDDLRKKDEYLAKIQSSGKLLLELINDTLDLSRIESGKMTPDLEAVMTNDLLPSVVTSLMPSAELKGVVLIEKHSNYKNSAVWADKLKINKIALNLLSNAIKFTPAGGKVTVTIERGKLSNHKESYNFMIEDTGIGMSREFMKRMYEPFSQEKRSESVKYPGTGLGLSIVKRYVDLLGGTIEVESHLHKGTKWTVKIPVRRLENGLTKKFQEETAIDLQGKRILLCEDNYMNMEIAATYLKDKGMIVESAEDGAMGVDKFSKSEAGYYDAVLMDIQMPIMNGYQATERIRELDREDAIKVPIIAMTADAFEESIRKAKSVGMNAYITKPIDPQKMYEVIRRCLVNNIQ